MQGKRQNRFRIVAGNRASLPPFAHCGVRGTRSQEPRVFHPRTKKKRRGRCNIIRTTIMADDSTCHRLAQSRFNGKAKGGIVIRRQKWIRRREYEGWLGSLAFRQGRRFNSGLGSSSAVVIMTGPVSDRPPDASGSRRKTH